MSKISQELAKGLTKMLLDKKRVEMEKIQAEFIDAVETEYNKTIPDDVKKFAKKHPAYFCKTGTVRVDGNGFNNEYVSLKTRVICEGNSTPYFQPAKDAAVELKALHNKGKDAEQRYKAVKEETYGALLSLGTPKKIAEAFPELANHVNQPVVGLIVDVTGLKKKINALP